MNRIGLLSGSLDRHWTEFAEAFTGNDQRGLILRTIRRLAATANSAHLRRQAGCSLEAPPTTNPVPSLP